MNIGPRSQSIINSFYTLKVEMGYNRFNEEIWTCDLTDGIYNDQNLLVTQ